MLSIHERVSKQDESEREIEEEIIHPLMLDIIRFFFSCPCVEMVYSLLSSGPLQLKQG